MLRLFQSSNPVSLILLIIYAALVNLKFFLGGIPTSEISYYFIGDLLFNQWIPLNKLPQTVVPFFNLACIVTQAVLISMLMQGSKVNTKPSLLPALVFILLCSFFPDMLLNTPAVLSGFFLIWILFKIFSAYNKPKADTIYFDTGLLNGFVSLLFFPALVFSLYSLLAIIRMRSITFREFVLFLSGFMVIYFLAATAFFWFDLLPEFWEKQFHFVPDLTKLSNFFSTIVIVKLVLIGIALIISLLFYSNKFTSNLIQVRKYLGSFVSFFLFGILAFLFNSNADFGGLYFLMMGTSFFISYYFFHSKNRMTPEIIHITLLGATILFQYINFTA